MDIHEVFDTGYVEKLKEIVKQFDIEDKQQTNWELFEEFIKDLLKDNFSRFNRAIIQIVADPYDEGIETPQKIKNLFNYLVDDLYQLKTIKYIQNSDLITTDYDEIKDED